MVRERLMNYRFSRLTMADVRTVSDDLSSSSGGFSKATDQTMRITKLLGKEKLHEMIRASIADFVANDQSEAVEDENYDLQKAA